MDLKIRKILAHFWHSPSFTTYGFRGAGILRMLAVTPLVFTKFDEIFIASWMLFASVVFFGNIATQQLTVVLLPWLLWRREEGMT